MVISRITTWWPVFLTLIYLVVLTIFSCIYIKYFCSTFYYFLYVYKLLMNVFLCQMYVLIVSHCMIYDIDLSFCLSTYLSVCIHTLILTTSHYHTMVHNFKFPYNNVYSVRYIMVWKCVCVFEDNLDGWHLIFLMQQVMTQNWCNHQHLLRRHVGVKLEHNSALATTKDNICCWKNTVCTKLR